MNQLNEVLNKGRSERVYLLGDVTHLDTNPAVECKDGFIISIQCRSTAYCSPREDLMDVSGYSSFELGYPSESDSLIEEYAESDDYTNTVYPYVHRKVVEALLEKHGEVR